MKSSGILPIVSWTLAVFTTIVLTSCSSDSNDLINRANDLIKQGKSEEAISVLKQAASDTESKTNSQVDDALNEAAKLGALMARLGDYRDAEELHSKMLD